MPAKDIDVVGNSGSARDAVRDIPGLEVDVMVLDLRLQDGTGVEVCRAVRSVDPSITGLLLTSSDDDEALVASMLAGAAGYVIKLARNSDIVSAIRRVGSGKSLIDPASAQRVTRELTTGELRPPLVDGERAILTQVLGGLTDAQIAERMGIPRERASTEITRLVARILSPENGEGSAPLPTSPGKHRRTDDGAEPAARVAPHNWRNSPAFVHLRPPCSLTVQQRRLPRLGGTRMDTTRCAHRAPHKRHRESLRRGGGTPVVMHPPRSDFVPGSRPACESDPPCPCGRPALVIFTTEEFGDVTWCGA